MYNKNYSVFQQQQKKKKMHAHHLAWYHNIIGPAVAWTNEPGPLPSIPYIRTFLDLIQNRNVDTNIKIVRTVCSHNRWTSMKLIILCTVLAK